MRGGRGGASPFERFYSLVVLVKGLDGAVELLIGAVLLFAPTAAQAVLAAVAQELGEGVAVWQQSLADAVADAGQNLGGTAVALALFLVVHGLVELATVYCLIRRLVRAYPWAIGVLSVLLIVQLVTAVITPTVGAWVLVALDVLVVVLVALEYRRLRAEHAPEESAGTGAPKSAEPTGTSRA